MPISNVYRIPKRRRGSSRLAAQAARILLGDEQGEFRRVARDHELSYDTGMSTVLETNTQAAARRFAEAVEKDPERLGGEPVFRGTRVPVKSLFDHLSAGDSLKTFLDDFPGVTREQIRSVLDTAGSHLIEEVQHR
jgi:uncharacterized protein (DUF433 family)